MPGLVEDLAPATPIAEDVPALVDYQGSEGEQRSRSHMARPRARSVIDVERHVRLHGTTVPKLENVREATA